MVLLGNRRLARIPERVGEEFGGPSRGVSFLAPAGCR